VGVLEFPFEGVVKVGSATEAVFNTPVVVSVMLIITFALNGLVPTVFVADIR